MVVRHLKILMAKSAKHFCGECCAAEDLIGSQFYHGATVRSRLKSRLTAFGHVGSYAKCQMMGINAPKKMTAAFAIPHHEDSPGFENPKYDQRKQASVAATSYQTRTKISRTAL